MTSHLNDKLDLNAPTSNTASNFFRSADGSWNVLPIALGTLLSLPQATYCGTTSSPIRAR
jgi:hypothetical protein